MKFETLILFYRVLHLEIGVQICLLSLTTWEQIGTDHLMGVGQCLAFCDVICVYHIYHLFYMYMYTYLYLPFRNIIYEFSLE